VEQNRETVDRLSGGRLAYVWLPNTGQGGYTYFNRMYFAQQDRKGAVIDERNNGGGSAADYIVDVLSRELTGYFNSCAGDRSRSRSQWPPVGAEGDDHQRARIRGDLFLPVPLPEGGPLIGTRTGGLVGHGTRRRSSMAVGRRRAEGSSTWTEVGRRGRGGTGHRGGTIQRR
jgi:tricorn protease